MSNCKLGSTFTYRYDIGDVINLLEILAEVCIGDGCVTAGRKVKLY